VFGRGAAVRGVWKVQEQRLQVRRFFVRLVAVGVELAFQQVVPAGHQRFLRLIDISRQQVVVEILAHPGQIHPGLNPQRLQLPCRTDAGKQQDLRRANGACADDDFGTRFRTKHLTVESIFDAGGTAAVDDYPRHQRVRGDLKAGVFQHRSHKALPRAGALAVLGGGVIEPDAGHLDSVEVFRFRVAQRLGSVYESLGNRVPLSDPFNMERPALAVEFTGAVLVVFGLLEQRQDLVPGPPLRSVGSPGVVVILVAADVDHAVEGAAAAEDPAAWPVEAAVMGMFLRRSHHCPVVGSGQQQRPTLRAVDVGVGVHGSGLDNVDRVSGVEQAPRNDAACRACANYYVVSAVGWVSSHGVPP